MSFREQKKKKKNRQLHKNKNKNKNKTAPPKKRIFFFLKQGFPQELVRKEAGAKSKSAQLLAIEEEETCRKEIDRYTKRLRAEEETHVSRTRTEREKKLA
jgi:hypothetical protein